MEMDALPDSEWRASLDFTDLQFKVYAIEQYILIGLYLALVGALAVNTWQIMIKQ